MGGVGKNAVRYIPIIPTTSGALSITSVPTSIGFLDNIGVQVDVTGTLSGTLQVAVSANHRTDGFGNVLAVGTFIPIYFNYQGTSGTSITVTSGSPTPIFFDLEPLSAPYIELIWTYSSGSGNITAVLCGKSI